MSAALYAVEFAAFFASGWFGWDALHDRDARSILLTIGAMALAITAAALR